LQNMEAPEWMAVRYRNDPAALQEARSRWEQREQEQRAQIETHLGPAAFQKWQEYQATLGQRHRASSIQSTLAQAGTPLNAEQSKALLDALVTEARSQQPEMGVWINRGHTASSADQALKMQEDYHNRVLASVNSGLTDKQVSHLQSLFKRELEMQRASLRLQQAQGEHADNVSMISLAPHVPAIGFSGVITSAEAVPTEVSEQQ
jgi:hypothetical protein